MRRPSDENFAATTQKWLDDCRGYSITGTPATAPGPLALLSEGSTRLTMIGTPRAQHSDPPPAAGRQNGGAGTVIFASINPAAVAHMSRVLNQWHTFSPPGSYTSLRNSDGGQKSSNFSRSRVVPVGQNCALPRRGW